MTTILALLASKAGIYIGGVIFIALTWAASLWHVYAKGKASEKAKQAAKDRHAIDEAQAIDDAIAGRSAQANRAKLKEWTPWK